jgi:hypothetical protein
VRLGLVGQPPGVGSVGADDVDASVEVALCAGLNVEPCGRELAAVRRPLRQVILS